MTYRPRNPHWSQSLVLLAAMFPMSAFCILALATSRLAVAQSGSAARLKLPAGFTAELLYRVPAEQGSWVSLTNDPQGRLIVSDQYGKLYRITPRRDSQADVEEIDLNIGFAQGLLCAFDSLYVVSHGNMRNRIETVGGTATQEEIPAGLYRVRDTDNDDRYDSVELLREIDGTSEHGPHAVILGPDKKSLYLCAGNATRIPNPETSSVPRVWEEDQVLTRFPDATGFAATWMAPAGWICKTDPDGKAFELIAIGFRNQYDIAFDPNGELFTFDSDMQWDFGLPWYRPTRVCHVVSGGEFGWRTGSGKWPPYYPDSVPAVLDIGPGSPTGITFGTGAKFPAKYQNALFIADWSYGIIYSVHLENHGASFQATQERFCYAPALPITDLVINPADGAMYFLVGGRRLQSELYRVTYVGDEPITPASYPKVDADIERRRNIESFHTLPDTASLDKIWEDLADDDRFIRYAARIALEHQAVETWVQRATQETRAAQETDPQRTLEAITALARCGNEIHQSAAVAALDRLEWDSLSGAQRYHLMRNYGLILCRLGKPTESTQQSIRKLDAQFPTGQELIDLELAKILIAVQTPGATRKTVELLGSRSMQEQQIALAMSLSDAKAGWTIPLREKYFQWFLDAAGTTGGQSLGGYVNSVRDHAVENLTSQEKSSLAAILAKQPEISDPYADLKARPFVEQWTLDDLLPIMDVDFARRDLVNGKELFLIASCYKCHRISGQGGIVGPDLTTAGHRFNAKDLLETIINPNKEISDQYEATLFQMDDGRVITGRIADMTGDTYKIQEDMINPGKLTLISITEIEAMKPSKTSTMPSGLLDTLTRDEILDLLAYMKSTVDN